MGDDATNNEAGHEALCRGIQECGRRYDDNPAHVTIVGGSQVILRQVAGDNATVQPNLQHAVTKTRRALRTLASYDLHHTLRMSNKMADHLANLAMDQRHTAHGRPTSPNSFKPTRKETSTTTDPPFPHTTTFSPHCESDCKPTDENTRQFPSNAIVVMTTHNQTSEDRHHRLLDRNLPPQEV